jgi:hypothetical protein
MRRIILQSLNQKEIRNDQAGDWMFPEDGTSLPLICSSAWMTDWRSELAVAVHEMIEALLCEQHGVTDLQVTQHDAMFEEERTKGLHGLYAEAGDDPRAPYRDEHAEATFAERAICAALGLAWGEHERNVEALFET